MLSRIVLLLAAGVCALFLYKGTLSATSNYNKKVPPPLPVPTKPALLETEKEYLLVGSNPAFHKATPKLTAQKREHRNSTKESLLRKITLKGTINAPGQKNDRAIIADKTTGKDVLLNIGDKIYGHTVVHITNKAVMLQTQTEKIELTYAK